MRGKKIDRRVLSLADASLACSCVRIIQHCELIMMIKPWSPLPLSFDSQILQSIDFYHISRHFRVRDYLVITSHSDVNGELTLGDNDMCCRIQELCANHSRINLAL